MAKSDIRKDRKDLYSPPSFAPVLVDVPSMKYLMADGAGDPTVVPAFREAVEALYAVAYAVKFMVKRGDPSADYVVPPLEGLWWLDDMSRPFPESRHDWKWTAMIMQPPPVTPLLLTRASAEVARKKALPALPKVRIEEYREGLSAQILHVGPYEAETPTIHKLHDFLKKNGYALNGKHHEIYLSDPRRTAPDRLKTVIRQPVRTA